jgi:putative transposon-encoded protein
MEQQEFKFKGYSLAHKIAKIGGHSARVFVPKSWDGKKVVVILLEDLDE